LRGRIVTIQGNLLRYCVFKETKACLRDTIDIKLAINLRGKTPSGHYDL